MLFKNYYLYWLFIYLGFFWTSEKSFGQPGKPFAIAISKNEPLFQNNLGINNIEIKVNSFKDSIQYRELQKFENKSSKNNNLDKSYLYGTFDETMIYFAHNDYLFGIVSRLNIGSIIQITFKDISNKQDPNIHENMKIYIRMAYSTTWDDEIKLVYLDSLYVGEFFYDMCQSQNYTNCRGSDEWTPMIYDGKGRMISSGSKILDLSCIEDHRIPENSIIEIITTTNCDDKEAIKRQWEE